MKEILDVIIGLFVLGCGTVLVFTLLGIMSDEQ